MINRRKLPLFLMTVFTIGLIAVTLVSAYLLVQGQINHATAARAQQARSVCAALRAMDNAKNGATFPKYPGAKSGQGYGQKLSAAIHQLVISTGCDKA